MIFYKYCALLYLVFVVALVPGHSTLGTLLIGTAYTLGGGLWKRCNKCVVIKKILNWSFEYCSLILLLLLHLHFQLWAWSRVDHSCWLVSVYVFCTVLSFWGRIIHIASYLTYILMSASHLFFYSDLYYSNFMSIYRFNCWKHVTSSLYSGFQGGQYLLLVF